MKLQHTPLLWTALLLVLVLLLIDPVVGQYARPTFDDDDDDFGYVPPVTPAPKPQTVTAQRPAPAPRPQDEQVGLVDIKSPSGVIVPFSPVLPIVSPTSALEPDSPAAAPVRPQRRRKKKPATSTDSRGSVIQTPLVAVDQEVQPPQGGGNLVLPPPTTFTGLPPPTQVQAALPVVPTNVPIVSTAPITVISPEPARILPDAPDSGIGSVAPVGLGFDPPLPGTIRSDRPAPGVAIVTPRGTLVPTTPLVTSSPVRQNLDSPAGAVAPVQAVPVAQAPPVQAVLVAQAPPVQAVLVAQAPPVQAVPVAQAPLKPLGPATTGQIGFPSAAKLEPVPPYRVKSNADISFAPGIKQLLPKARQDVKSIVSPIDPANLPTFAVVPAPSPPPTAPIVTVSYYDSNPAPPFVSTSPIGDSNVLPPGRSPGLAPGVVIQSSPISPGVLTPTSVGPVQQPTRLSEPVSPGVPVSSISPKQPISAIFVQPAYAPSPAVATRRPTATLAISSPASISPAEGTPPTNGNSFSFMRLGGYGFDNGDVPQTFQLAPAKEMLPELVPAGVRVRTKSGVITSVRGKPGLYGIHPTPPPDPAHGKRRPAPPPEIVYLNQPSKIVTPQRLARPLSGKPLSQVQVAPVSPAPANRPVDPNVPVPVPIPQPPSVLISTDPTSASPPLGQVVSHIPVDVVPAGRTIQPPRRRRPGNVAYKPLRQSTVPFSPVLPDYPVKKIVPPTDSISAVNLQILSPAPRRTSTRRPPTSVDSVKPIKTGYVPRTPQFIQPGQRTTPSIYREPASDVPFSTPQFGQRIRPLSFAPAAPAPPAISAISGVPLEGSVNTGRTPIQPTGISGQVVNRVPTVSNLDEVRPRQIVSQIPIFPPSNSRQRPLGPVAIAPKTVVTSYGDPQFAPVAPTLIPFREKPTLTIDSIPTAAPVQPVQTVRASIAPIYETPRGVRPESQIKLRTPITQTSRIPLRPAYETSLTQGEPPSTPGGRLLTPVEVVSSGPYSGPGPRLNFQPAVPATIDPPIQKVRVPITPTYEAPRILIQPSRGARPEPQIKLRTPITQTSRIPLRPAYETSLTQGEPPSTPGGRLLIPVEVVSSGPYSGPGPRLNFQPAVPATIDPPIQKVRVPITPTYEAPRILIQPSRGARPEPQIKLRTPITQTSRIPLRPAYETSLTQGEPPSTPGGRLLTPVEVVSSGPYSGPGPRLNFQPAVPATIDPPIQKVRFPITPTYEAPRILIQPSRGARPEPQIKLRTPITQTSRIPLRPAYETSLTQGEPPSTPGGRLLTPVEVVSSGPYSGPGPRLNFQPSVPATIDPPIQKVRVPITPTYEAPRILIQPSRGARPEPQIKLRTPITQTSRIPLRPAYETSLTQGEPPSTPGGRLLTPVEVVSSGPYSGPGPRLNFQPAVPATIDPPIQKVRVPITPTYEAPRILIQPSRGARPEPQIKLRTPITQTSRIPLRPAYETSLTQGEPPSTPGGRLLTPVEVVSSGPYSGPGPRLNFQPAVPATIDPPIQKVRVPITPTYEAPRILIQPSRGARPEPQIKLRTPITQTSRIPLRPAYETSLTQGEPPSTPGGRLLTPVEVVSSGPYSGPGPRLNFQPSVPATIDPPIQKVRVPITPTYEAPRILIQPSRGARPEPQIKLRTPITQTSRIPLRPAYETSLTQGEPPSTPGGRLLTPVEVVSSGPYSGPGPRLNFQPAVPATIDPPIQKVRVPITPTYEAPRILIQPSRGARPEPQIKLRTPITQTSRIPLKPAYETPLTQDGPRPRLDIQPEVPGTLRPPIQRVRIPSKPSYQTDRTVLQPTGPPSLLAPVGVLTQNRYTGPSSRTDEKVVSSAPLSPEGPRTPISVQAQPVSSQYPSVLSRDSQPPAPIAVTPTAGKTPPENGNSFTFMRIGGYGFDNGDVPGTYQIAPAKEMLPELVPAGVRVRTKSGVITSVRGRPGLYGIHPTPPPDPTHGKKPAPVPQIVYLKETPKAPLTTRRPVVQSVPRVISSAQAPPEVVQQVEAPIRVSRPPPIPTGVRQAIVVPTSRPPQPQFVSQGPPERVAPLPRKTIPTLSQVELHRVSPRPQVEQLRPPVPPVTAPAVQLLGPQIRPSAEPPNVISPTISVSTGGGAGSYGNDLSDFEDFESPATQAVPIGKVTRIASSSRPGDTGTIQSPRRSDDDGSSQGQLNDVAITSPDGKNGAVNVVIGGLTEGPYNFGHRHTHGNGYAVVKLGVPLYRTMESESIAVAELPSPRPYVSAQAA